MTRIWFLSAIFGAFCKAASYDHTAHQWTDPSYSRRLSAVVDILWESFTAEIQLKENALHFSVPFVTDMTFMYDVLDEETKQQFRKLIDVFDVGLSESSQTTTAYAELSQTLSNGMRFRTIFYGETEMMNERNLNGFVMDKLSLPNNRFNLITVRFDDDLQSMLTLFSLLKEFETDSIGLTCDVGRCSVQQILFSKPPFAIITFSSLEVKAVSGFQWTAPTKFILSEKSVAQVLAAQGYSNYNYAEFNYANGCIGRVLRLSYSFDFYLAFVIPWGKQMCSSSQLLWENVQSVNFNDLQYRNKTMFVSIPLFNVSENIDLKLKLKGTTLGDAFYQPSSRLYNALALQAAEVIFNPKVIKHLSKPVVISDVTTFEAKSPFFFALFHETISSPIAAGLISNPICPSECDVTRK